MNTEIKRNTKGELAIFIDGKFIRYVSGSEAVLFNEIDAQEKQISGLQTERATMQSALEAQSATIAELQQFRDTLQATLRRQQMENERYKAALVEIKNISFPDDYSGNSLIYRECIKALAESASTEAQGSQEE